MDKKTFDEAIAGIRTAERGVEVREDIAQGMEYVKQYAEEVTGDGIGIGAGCFAGRSDRRRSSQHRDGKGRSSCRERKHGPDCRHQRSQKRTVSVRRRKERGKFCRFCRRKREQSRRHREHRQDAERRWSPG